MGEPLLLADRSRLQAYIWIGDHKICTIYERIKRLVSVVILFLGNTRRLKFDFKREIVVNVTSKVVQVMVVKDRSVMQKSQPLFIFQTEFSDKIILVFVFYSIR
jgi:hypothetical protein